VQGIQGKPRWHRVIIQKGAATVLDHLAGTYARPAIALGARCACCSAETPYQMEYSPSSESFSTTPIRVPRCRECIAHLQSKNPNQDLALLAIVAWAGLIFMAVTTSWLYGIAAAVVVVAFVLFVIRRRRRRQVLQAQGHYTGLVIVAVPNAMHVRTTNPQLALDIAALNSRG